MIRRRIEAAGKRLAVIAAHLQRLALAEAERKKREQQAEEVVYWQSFKRLCRQPTQENATVARRAFLFLARRHHPDTGRHTSRFLAGQGRLWPRTYCLAETWIVSCTSFSSPFHHPNAILFLVPALVLGDWATPFGWAGTLSSSAPPPARFPLVAFVCRPAGPRQLSSVPAGVVPTPAERFAPPPEMG